MVLERLHLPYLIVGSMASIAYGEPRFTHDVDILSTLIHGLFPPFAKRFHHQTGMSANTPPRRQSNNTANST
jgi:hypothetical protein